MDLSSLKRDKGFLLSILGVPETAGKTQHAKCPFHSDKMGSLSLWQDSDGSWLWKCHSGCGTGTIIDATMLKHGTKSCFDAIKHLESSLGVTIAKDEEYQEPLIDLKKAEAFIAEAHKKLCEDFELQEKYMVSRRGINTLDIIKKYRIGFLTDARLFNGRARIFGWVLPITDAGGNLRAVKLHTERPPWPNGPKCLWAPFGTYPKGEPKHGTFTLWPPPESYKEGEALYLCPGELKAVVMLSSGFNATAPTSGENKFPQRLVDRISKCKPGKVCVVFDDDTAGIKWRDSVISSLNAAGVPTTSFSLGSPEPATDDPENVEPEDSTVRDSRIENISAGSGSNPVGTIAPDTRSEANNEPCKSRSEPAHNNLDDEWNATPKAKNLDDEWKTKSTPTARYDSADQFFLENPHVYPSPETRFDAPTSFKKTTKTLIDWFLRVRESLPAPPFQLAPHMRVTGGKFYDAIASDIACGPGSPRVMSGALENDLILLQGVAYGQV